MTSVETTSAAQHTPGPAFMGEEHARLHEALKDQIADMESLSRHAQFVQVSAVIRNLEALLNLAREANAEAYRDRTPHWVPA